ncbi:hypothetical protein [Sporosarcina sp. E16_8]|uniref:capping complex subunit for YIEGIA n=1 Tax=Sporosarcina sp. E16_8 TaxID=2789295 RepID=UPI001A92C071|nr:hypothetical protein [Sporosarcina sp. E16_8]MBO0586853.1 hypothetical protein [Sporosarcina sp. E16_8]
MENQHAKIVAIITTKPETIQGGGAPVFIVKDNKELQKVSMTLEQVMDASPHEIDTDTFIIFSR